MLSRSNAPEHVLFLSLAVEIEELQAKQNAQKSLLNRIEGAKREFISTGRIQTGRRRNPKTGELEIDPKKQKKIERGARLILTGTSVPKAGRLVAMNSSHLREMLFHSCTETADGPF